MKKLIENPALKTWSDLNDVIRTANEDECGKLLEQEIAGRNRKQFIKRIHSRLNKARADRERKELGVSR